MSLNRSNADLRSRENQSKFIQDRIGQVEKYFGDLCTGFAAIARKNARLRDKGDEVSKTVVEYAEHETLNHTTKTGLQQFAENLSAVQDYRNAQVKRIEALVVEPLTVYGNSCKHAKDDLKQAFSAYDKEAKSKKNAEKAREKHPSDRHMISQAETELQRAAVDATVSSKALEEKMESFEKKKLHDIKKILEDFVNIEMAFHSKALEVYTFCYQSLQLVSEEDDLEEFRNTLRPPNVSARLEMQRASSQTSLNSTQRSLQVPQRATPKQTPTTPRKENTPPKPPKPPVNPMYGDDDDDYDDYDSDEDSYLEEKPVSGTPGGGPGSSTRTPQPRTRQEARR